MVQQMLFTQRIMKSLGLKVRMPMILEVDNTGAIELAKIIGVQAPGQSILMFVTISCKNWLIVE